MLLELSILLAVPTTFSTHTECMLNCSPQDAQVVLDHLSVVPEAHVRLIMSFVQLFVRQVRDQEATRRSICG
jgi:hypothetical protein